MKKKEKTENKKNLFCRVLRIWHSKAGVRAYAGLAFNMSVAYACSRNLDVRMGNFHADVEFKVHLNVNILSMMCNNKSGHNAGRGLVRVMSDKLQDVSPGRTRLFVSAFVADRPTAIDAGSRVPICKHTGGEEGDKKTASSSAWPVDPARSLPVTYIVHPFSSKTLICSCFIVD